MSFRKRVDQCGKSGRLISMARAVNDDTLSAEILRSAADELKTQLG